MRRTKPDSIIRTGIVIGRDIPEERPRAVTIDPSFVTRIIGTSEQGLPKSQQKDLFETAEEKQIARTTLEVIHEEFERLPRSTDLMKPETMRNIAASVEKRLRPTQPVLFADPKTPELIGEVVARTIQVHNELTIDIPRIIVVPKGEVTSGYRDFDMDCKTIRLQPVSQEILIQHLHDREQHRLQSGAALIREERPENYLVRGLVDFDDVDYFTQAQLLYKLAGQVVAHLRGYLASEDDVLNVLQAHQQVLVNTIYSQMQEHFAEETAEYEVKVTKGFTTLRPANYSIPADESPRNFRTPVAEKLLIRGMLFGGFGKCLYPALKFQSDTERRLAIVFENDATVKKWFKPMKGQFQIFYSHDDEYVPDFAVETADTCYLCEPKASDEMDDTVVQAKARAAVLWCRRAANTAAASPGNTCSFRTTKSMNRKPCPGCRVSSSFKRRLPDASRRCLTCQSMQAR